MPRKKDKRISFIPRGRKDDSAQGYESRMLQLRSTTSPAEEKQYRIGHRGPSGSIEWLDGIYSEEEAKRKCDAANYVEAGGRMLETVGHCRSEGRDSGFRWVYEATTSPAEEK